MNNIVFIPNIDTGNDRCKSYQYSIASWKNWCNKNNIQLVVWETPIYPIDSMKITWQRHYAIDILEHNKIEYDQILVVDADTIIHPDCPNFFDITEHKFCAVLNNGCWEWVCRSINIYQNLFVDAKINPYGYINGGFLIYNSTHRLFLTTLIEFYLQHRNTLINIQNKHKVGTDQTALNYLLKRENIDVKILPQEYNLQDLARKNLLYIDQRYWFEDSLKNLANSCYIAHCNAIPPNPMNRDASYWIERIYKEWYK